MNISRNMWYIYLYVIIILHKKGDYRLQLKINFVLQKYQIEVKIKKDYDFRSQAK